ncbi:phenylalanine--tRNA ligase subunit alpha, partial [Candidatus Dependentiae bacterium]|nr:phenylalanine--tRNA ligase subunit alpha [Candidatus Dependentiae bacterium]
KKASSKNDIESIRVQYLGKKGNLSNILKLLGSFPADKRREIGKVANEARDFIENLIEAGFNNLQNEVRNKILDEKIDVTLPGRMPALGHRHPLNLISQQILEVLTSLGFDLVQGPEIEHDFYNFEALNIPQDHPAREMQDTFYVNKDIVLRTQTSPVQIRTMLSLKETPIRIVSMGRVFRRDQDITHSPIFHQIEGLFVDKHVTFADLKGTLTVFIERIFSKKACIRMRPSYFPFTEPSAEVDVSCFACDGAGCRLCKETGFIEILGAGMVDPEVFKAANLDPEKVSGFAFGIGVERVAMLKYGISDIRHFYDNDLRFLSQF